MYMWRNRWPVLFMRQNYWCRLPLNVPTWLLRWGIRDTRKQITSSLKLGWMRGSLRMWQLLLLIWIIRVAGISGIRTFINYLQVSNSRRIWIGIPGWELFPTMNIVINMIRVNGVAGMTSVWEPWVTGGHIYWILFTSSLNWACLMKWLWHIRKDTMITSSLILLLFFSASRSVKECHR